MRRRRDYGYATPSKDCRPPAPALVRSDEFCSCAGAKRRQPRRKRCSNFSPLDLLHAQARTHIRTHTHIRTCAWGVSAEGAVGFRRQTDVGWLALTGVRRCHIQARTTSARTTRSTASSRPDRSRRRSPARRRAPFRRPLPRVRAGCRTDGPDRRGCPRAPERSLCACVACKLRVGCTLRVRVRCPMRCDASVVEASALCLRLFACLHVCARACACACLRVRVNCACVRATSKPTMIHQQNRMITDH